MLCRVIFNTIQRTICINAYTFHTLKNASKFNSDRYNSLVCYPYLQQNPAFMFKRFKKKATFFDDEESKDENDSLDIDEYLNTKQAKVLYTKVPSLRLDVIAKAGLGMSRTQLDKEFYNSKLRINGKKCLKKSKMVEIGDEIDHIVGESPDNPNYLIVNRCVLISIDIDEEKDQETIGVKLIRNKSLLIEDYKH